MSPLILLLVYCVLILLSSLVGGWIPMLLRLTHRRMEIALSFVSGVMLGVALMHLLPHAIAELSVADDGGGGGGGGGGGVAYTAVATGLRWMLAGFLTMFFIERFFCFHHHEAPVAGLTPSGDGESSPVAGGAGCADHDPGDPDQGHGHGHEHGHGHSLRWGGAAAGLTLHTLIAGVALAASVQSGHSGHAHGHDHGHDHGADAVPLLAGLSTFLVIFLHKPFDSLTIGTLMAAGRNTMRARHAVNLLFSLAIPAGVGLFYAGLGLGSASSHEVVGVALAFSAGTFLCIALSDLLPELQFHRHDRLALSLALLAGLAVSWVISLAEG